MAYAGSIDDKMQFNGGAIFAKFGLFCSQKCNFAPYFKSIADRGLLLVAFPPYAASNDDKMKFVGCAIFAKFGLFGPQNCIFAHNFKSIADRGLLFGALPLQWHMPVPMMPK